MSKFLQKTEETNPFTFMRRMTEELDRAFGLKSNIPGLSEFYPRMWSPEIEVLERDNKFVRPCRPARLEEGERENRSHPRRVDD